MPHAGNARRHHRAPALVQVRRMQIQTQNKLKQRTLAVPFPIERDTQLPAREKMVAPVDDVSAVCPNRGEK